MKNCSILYIDDEYMNLLAFEAQFRRSYDVYCVASEAQAIEHLSSKSIQFVFSDQRMPKILGTEFLAKIRSRFPEVHRAIISGFIDDEAIKKGLENEVLDIAFEKPFKVKEIEDYIRKKMNGRPQADV